MNADSFWLAERGTYVYVISMLRGDGSHVDLFGRRAADSDPDDISHIIAVKIGISDNPWSRLASLQVASPFELRLEHAVLFDRIATAQMVERQLHHACKQGHIRGEWFANVDPYDVYCAIGRGALDEAYTAATDNVPWRGRTQPEKDTHAPTLVYGERTGSNYALVSRRLGVEAADEDEIRKLVDDALAADGWRTVTLANGLRVMVHDDAV